MRAVFIAVVCAAGCRPAGVPQGVDVCGDRPGDAPYWACLSPSDGIPPIEEPGLDRRVFSGIVVEVDIETSCDPNAARPNLDPRELARTAFRVQAAERTWDVTVLVPGAPLTVFVGEELDVRAILIHSLSHEELVIESDDELLIAYSTGSPPIVLDTPKLAVASGEPECFVEADQQCFVSVRRSLLATTQSGGRTAKTGETVTLGSLSVLNHDRLIPVETSCNEPQTPFVAGAFVAWRTGR